MERGSITTGPDVFINYRRNDTRADAGRLCDFLAEQFGEHHVFIDIDTLRPGVDFAIAIDETLRRCDVLLVVIGPTWLTVADENGKRRLDDPKDLVRKEIEIALLHGRPIVPVLVGGADMPSLSQMPDSLALLTRRHAHHLTDHRWKSAALELVDAIEVLSGKQRLHQKPGPDLAPPILARTTARTDSISPYGAQERADTPRDNAIVRIASFVRQRRQAIAALVVAVVVAVAVGGIILALHTSARETPSAMLRSGDKLLPGQLLRSLNGTYSLEMQSTDGNLVIYRYASTKPTWATKTLGSSLDYGDYAVMQADGNFVIYPKGASAPPPGQCTRALWYSNTVGNPGAYLELRDNGDLVIKARSGGTVLWQSWKSTGVRGLGCP